MASMAAAAGGRCRAVWAASAERRARRTTGVPRVAVDDLATTLQDARRSRSIDSFWKVGNAIISDPVKLAGGRRQRRLPAARRRRQRLRQPASSSSQTTDAEGGRQRRQPVARAASSTSRSCRSAYPVWNTGMTRSADPDSDFTLRRHPHLGRSPFTGAPRASWAFTLEQVATAGAPDPLPGMDTKRWRVWIMVGRDRHDATCAPPTRILGRMFGAADPDDPARSAGAAARAGDERGDRADTCRPERRSTAAGESPAAGMPEPRAAARGAAGRGRATRRPARPRR